MDGPSLVFIGSMQIFVFPTHPGMRWRKCSTVQTVNMDEMLIRGDRKRLQVVHISKRALNVADRLALQLRDAGFNCPREVGLVRGSDRLQRVDAKEGTSKCASHRDEHTGKRPGKP